ncbi:hypothetical protein B0T22DRAFT_486943 [Podospora appendiculata]|uniref:BTB domain-containing protein n=1 Tax=Podospora appendiculata TaxID=314037 RepID=A0AAE1CFZ8_9PEZI|nr:hypothetical protein B0T22DRAFT_486943 [Podospora appendiculata]
MEAEPETPSRVVLDPDGDVILVVKDLDSTRSGEFVVSSKVLSLASPYFAALTGPNFMEGQQLRSGQHKQTPISLHEDDLDAMDSLLKILHFQSLGELSPKEIAMVAIQSKKYLCSTALRPWAQKWCGQGLDQPGISMSAVDKGHLILAAHLILPSDALGEFTEKIIVYLPRNFAADWKKSDIIQKHFPEELIEKLSSCIRRTLMGMQKRLEHVEFHLQHQSAYFEMVGEQCLRCGSSDGNCCTDDRNGPSPRITVKKYCTQPCRVSDYFRILAMVRLWPFSNSFLRPNVAVFDISQKAQNGLKEEMTLKHICAGGLIYCPLLVSLRTAIDNLKIDEESMGAILWAPEEPLDSDDDPSDEHGEDADGSEGDVSE